MKRKIIRQYFLISILFTLICIFVNSSWAEEKYPSRPIDLWCGSAPGGQGDLANRAISKKLEQYLGVTVVPGNKPGGGWAVVVAFLAGSRPDGYTMAILTPEQVIQNILLGRANYKLEDFYIIGQIYYISNVWAVSADSPWKTIQEFIDYARKNPGVKYGHPGVGTATFLRTENINKRANLGLINVPFRSDPENISAVLGKHIPLACISAMAGKVQADAGKMRILFSFEPPAEIGLDPTIPDLKKTFGEIIGDIDIDIPFNLAVPAKTPIEIVQVLRTALEKTVKDPEFVGIMKGYNHRVQYVDGNTIMQNLPKRMSIDKKILELTGLLK